MVLWFRIEDFEITVGRTKKLNIEVIAEPHVNPNAKQNEFWFKDPDGYLVVISNKMGSAKQHLVIFQVSPTKNSIRS
jgi:hypothetical protein